MEAAAVEPRGRISREDLGIWDDDHIVPLQRVVEVTKSNGAAIGIQLAHAGRKAGTPENGNWEYGQIAPSSVQFDDGWHVPNELDQDGIAALVQNFSAAAERAVEAGFDMVEIHGAHGYLISSFLSPLANRRSDEYGGNIENRCRFAVEVVGAVRRVIPDNLPIFVRISGSDFAEGGTVIEDSVVVARMLSGAGADLIDVSGGGNTAKAAPTLIGYPGYQVGHAARIRNEVGIPTMAVGMITSSVQAEQIIRSENADLIALGRELLRNPYWPLAAASQLATVGDWPEQYGRARDE
jgi:2,4-dienoyl-CoA reductase-like NADH-dependent reductase (Old Yellow Enzyme family)